MAPEPTWLYVLMLSLHRKGGTMVAALLCGRMAGLCLGALKIAVTMAVGMVITPSGHIII